MSDDDDVLAIVAALEFLESHDTPAPARSKWRYDDENYYHTVTLSGAPWRAQSKGTWKNS